MPTRIVREGILTSERINALSANAELFYRRLMSVADDHGRYPANPTQLRAYCYPLKLDSVKEDSIKKHLAECEEAGLIVLYTVAEKYYLQINDFGQRINGKSKFPEPSGESRGIPGDSRLGGGEGDDEGGGGRADAPPPCPHQDIVDLYHVSLPTLSRVKEWSDARKEQLRTRWREDAKRQSLDYWQRFFKHVAASDFLMGRANPKPGAKAFSADLEWLTKSSNFIKVIEGKYHDASQ
jgi:hypothetical protein